VSGGGWWQADEQGPPPPTASAPVPEPPRPPPPGWTAGPVVDRSTDPNALAIASLLLGVLWLGWVGSLLALVCGYRGLHQIRATGGRQPGRGYAVAGIVLGWIGVATLALFLLSITAIT
jgi:hypothetical protein